MHQQFLDESQLTFTEVCVQIFPQFITCERNLQYAGVVLGYW